MNTTCPHCQAVNEIKKIVRETRLTCTNCKLAFTIPAEDLCLDEQDDSRFVKKQLKRKHREVPHEHAYSADQPDEYIVQTPIARKLTKRVLLIYFIVILCVDTVFMVYQYINARQLIYQDLETTHKMFGKGLGVALWFVDNGSVEAAILGMLEHPVIIGVKVVDKQNELIGTGGVFQDSKGKYVTFQEEVTVNPSEEALPFKSRNHPVRLLFSHSVPIAYSEEEENSSSEVGQVTLYSSISFIFQRVKGSYALLLVNSFIVALALILDLLWESRKILAQPLSILTNAVTSLNLKNLDTLEVALPSSEKNEFKILETAFNRMVKNLIDEQQANIQMTRTFEKFIPKQLLSRIAAHGVQSIRLGGITDEKMTVLYCRIHTAENMSATNDAADIFEYLNEYLSNMNKAIEKHGGFMYKYSNDDIMAFFDLNDPPLEALSSIYAAIDMHKAVKILNQQEKREGTSSISISIGIDCGKVWLGAIGSENRIEATGIGSPIETAINLQSLTHQYQSQILITEQILEQVKSFHACLTREVGGIGVSETAAPLRIFEVFDAEPTREIKQQLLPAFQEGVRLLQNKRWDGAKKSFETCLAIYPDDVVSKMYLEHCRTDESKDKIAVFLRNECRLSPVLREAESIKQLTGDFELVTFEDGDHIMDIGHSNIRFHLIFKGIANVFVRSEKGGEIHVSTLEKGESFGAIHLLTGDPVSAIIKSVGTSQILAMNRGRFDSMVRRYPQLNHYFHKQHSKYLADLQSVLLRNVN